MHCSIMTVLLQCKSFKKVSPRQADPPDSSRLPQDDIVGVTVLLLTCSYQNKVRSASSSLSVFLKVMDFFCAAREKPC